jgi:transcription initiation factor TFIIH subunit 4
MSATLTEYLEGLQGATLKKLYKQPSTVLAVLRRMLPHLAKNIVMAMLYMPAPFLESDLYTWIKSDCLRERDEAVDVLKRLYILEIHPDHPTPRAYRLDPSFSLSLRQALAGGGNHNSFGVPCTKPDPQRMSIQDLDQWSRAKWEAILYYMVGAMEFMSASSEKISNGTMQLLSFGGFVQQSGPRAKITKEGFSFILQEANTQVWQLLLVYLDQVPNVRTTNVDELSITANAQQLKMDPVEVLSFLFMLGSLTLGQDYSTAPLTQTQLQMLYDLSDLGVVYRPADDPSRYYPTRLATTLTSDAGAIVESSVTPTSIDGVEDGPAGKGYIILETNHRVYAYTNSALQIQILGLFAKLHSRFPNLVSGQLTKHSINRAIQQGITSDQIIAYLTTHAHPQMLRNNPVLPPTVVDQIRLWQLEEDRMKSTPGFMLQEFNSFQEYKDIVDYAEQLGVVLWRKDQLMKFFVSDIRQLQAFIKSRQSKQK